MINDFAKYILYSNSIKISPPPEQNKSQMVLLTDIIVVETFHLKKKHLSSFKQF